MAAPAPSRGPLEGLRVVEMAGLGPCPLAGQLLADLGAEVIVIERASGGPRPHDVNNRGKRSAALNLKTPEGVEAALRLIDRADALIEGFRPGVMEKLGLGPEICHARNPALVYGRMTGWGQSGPLARTAGHDINYLALTGALWMMGERDRPPTPPLNLVADYGGGAMFLLLGVLAALWERGRSGRGQVVDAAMVDGVSAFGGIFRMMSALGAWREERQANLLDGGAPFYRCYETRDGKYLAVGPLEPQFFAQLLERAGLPAAHLADQNDRANWPERARLYAEVFRSRTRDEWERIFAGSDACVAPVLAPSEAPAHPHNAARGAHVEVEGVLQAAPAPRFDRTPAPAPRPPAPAGADTEAVLREAGLDDAAIDALRQAGALT
ncbi:CaiB/BaiF CoA transferase family protein [Oceanicella actignis]|uniref:CaiB/BaiF CoA transferase family protein n=1 Tax=Oceanicella actignis TaxID=1189325 RepID=UPI0011E7F08E|nr:CaiB/BaiF CoA-transferase family protein [Oceanicella actignis]TYO89613.1 alpha-methylacyl-CoA racemase [Oceanicella actignis]